MRSFALLFSSSTWRLNNSHLLAQFEPSLTNIMTDEQDMKEMVGFGSLPQQYVDRVLREGFVFNLLLVGRNGVGKTALLNSLFKTQFPTDENPGCKELNVQTHELHEAGTKLKLTTVETQGLGDPVGTRGYYKNVVEYIDSQMEKYFEEESRMVRTCKDTRIHCCIYLLPPCGYGLSELDLTTMRQLHTRVNVIPVIGKVDTMTTDELTDCQKKVRSDIESSEIKIYKFPTDDPRLTDFNAEMNDLAPLAISASMDFVEINGEQKLIKDTPLHTLQVDDPNHSDLPRLRKAVLAINMQDLIEVTHSKFFASYRTRSYARRSMEISLLDVKPQNVPKITYRKQDESLRSPRFEPQAENDTTLGRTIVSYCHTFLHGLLCFVHASPIQRATSWLSIVILVASMCIFSVLIEVSRFYICVAVERPGALTRYGMFTWLLDRTKWLIPLEIALIMIWRYKFELCCLFILCYIIQAIFKDVMRWLT